MTPMGLDLVELVMEVEDAFGVSIPNESASMIHTVGDLHRAVLALSHQKPHDGVMRCPSAVGFYKTRAALMGALNVERRTIRPETLLDEVFPLPKRRGRYQAWTRAMQPWRTPILRLPPYLTGANAVTLLAGASFVLALGYFLAGNASPRRAGIATLIGVGALFLGAVLLAVCETQLKLGRRFPTACHTVGDLSQMVLLANSGLAAPGPSMTADFAWRMLVPIVSAQLGIPENEIHPDSRFVEDLHAD